MLRKNHSRMRKVLPDVDRVLAQLLIAILMIACDLSAQSLVLQDSNSYLRNGKEKEWATFPDVVREKQLVLPFEWNAGTEQATLSLRQFDVRQNWRILLNDKDIGGLVVDEKDINSYFSIPANSLRKGHNTLVIKANDATPDDILMGHLQIDSRSLKDILSEVSVEITVIGEDQNKTVPSRITIIDHNRVLQTISTKTNEGVAVRPGYVYTAHGKTTVLLPAGQYTIYAGRGFEYSIDSLVTTLKAGQHIEHTFRIRKEVETSGWISSDTHVHTFTYSRHGDATLEERAITLAAEGIELPVITDHNQNIDISPVARATDVSAYFTPVTGDELTTRFGHFNIFKTDSKEAAFNPDIQSWNDIVSKIKNSDNHLAVILNHARDIHNEFTPFDPSHHISSAGYSTLNWALPANAMEVMNSGSQQTNIINLYNDWFGMLNHGRFLTPVGSSDSHDVSRFTVGQGRTYILSGSESPSDINVDQAIKNFIEGKVLVSLGLLTKLKVAGTYGPGDLCPRKNNIDVSVEVLGPGWAQAQRVSLYINGVKLEDRKIKNSRAAGQKWKGVWSIPAPAHDIFIVAIADGNGAGMPYWPLAEPYQPMSPEWTPTLIGSTGAVWIDVDGDGKRTSAFDYAQKVVGQAKGDLQKLVKLLSSYHESIAIQAAVLLWTEGVDLKSEKIQKLMKTAAPAIRNGFDRVIKETEMLR